MSDAGTHFILEKFQELCIKLKINHMASSFYDHQSSGHVESFVKLIKCAMKKCFDAKKDVNLALLQIRSTTIGYGLPSPANRLIRGLLTKIIRIPMLYDFNDDHYYALKQRQQWADKHDTYIDLTIIPVALTVAVQRGDGGLWRHDIVVEHGTKKHNNRSYKIHITLCTEW